MDSQLRFHNIYQFPCDKYDFVPRIAMQNLSNPLMNILKHAEIEKVAEGRTLGAAREQPYKRTRARICRADAICNIASKGRSDVGFWKEHPIAPGLRKRC